ncbi:MAG: Ig-like domain repeat protein [Acidobacteriaceae bacterium]
MGHIAPRHRTESRLVACLRILLLLLFIAACSLGAQTGRPGTASPAYMGQTPPSVLDGSATLVGHYDPTKMLRLAIALRPPHPAEEKQFLENLQNKQSPLFHQYLTADQWNARFAPSAEDEQAVVDWAKGQGLSVTNRYANRLIVDVEAPAGTIEKALNIVINTYQLPGSDASDPMSFRYSTDREPTLPAILTSVVQSVQGLNSFEAVRPASGGAHLVPQPEYVPGPVFRAGESAQKDAAAPRPSAAVSKAGGTGVTAPKSGYWTPADMFSSDNYDYGALMAQGHCCNPTNNANNSPPASSIAIAAFGDVSLTDVGDFQSYFNYLAYNVQKIYVDGTYSCNNSKGEDSNCGEVTLDTEWSLSMANSEGAASATSKVFVYEGVNHYDTTVLDVYNKILNDGNARVMSTSWLCPENYEFNSNSTCFNSTMQARDNVLSQMVGEGWTLVAAAGDTGATGACTDALVVDYPASDPNVVAVGGTELKEGSGDNYEVAWTGGTGSGSCSGNNGGGTGGFSEYWGVPGFQSGMGFSSRAVPDVALDAFYGHDTYLAGGWAYFGGTSVAAPMVAGFFAQDNAYMLSIGNKCGSSGTSACAPIGDADYPIYYEAKDPTGGRYPFYDTLIGCNSNDITAKYGLTAYCAGTGFDETTGWGSANMLQLAWAINWEDSYAGGYPYVTFSGPTTNKWYNNGQVVSWTVVDYTGGAPSSTGTGIAGFTQGWDSVPSDPSSEPHGGSGNSFYSGPQYTNTSTGCLSLVSGTDGCSGGVSQGCHTVNVEGWNNQGLSTGDATYGPLCYDTVAPTVSGATSPTEPGSGWFNSSVTLTLSATDPGGSNASGIAHTYWGDNNSSCQPGSTSSCSVYSSGIAFTSQGTNLVKFFSEDNAGNYSSVGSQTIDIDETAPSTTIGLSGALVGQVWESAVTVVLTATDNLSGVAATYYSLDGGANTQYGGSFSVSTPGAHTVTFYSVDVAGTKAAPQTTSFTIESPTITTLTASANPILVGGSVTLTATVMPSISGTPGGTVSFKRGGLTLGTGTLSGGVATLTTTALVLGNDNLTAVYGGATYYLASTSATLAETVQTNTTTTLMASPSLSSFGGPVTLTATVASTTRGTPYGTVTFKRGSVSLGSVSLASGTASLTTTALPVGSDSLTAVFNGGVYYVTSTSTALTVTVNAAATTTSLAVSANPATYGQSVTLTATVASTTTGTPKGVVTFKSGSATLGSAILSGGVALLTSTTLAVGSDSLTAVYSTSTDYLTSTSPPVTETVNPAATTTSLTVSPNPATQGATVTLTATVSSSTGAVVTGVVTFRNGSTTLGSVILSGGAATLNTAKLPVGSDGITATYGASAKFLTSTSAVVTEVVNASEANNSVPTEKTSPPGSRKTT